jgi:DNA repair protein RadA/Sms
VSSLTNTALPVDAAFFGEVSLSGTLRPVGHAASRLKEARKLGFEQVAVAQGSLRDAESSATGMHVAELRSVDDLTLWVREQGIPGGMRTDARGATQ